MNTDSKKSYPVLASADEWYLSAGFDKSKIRKITFVDSFQNNQSRSADFSWDVSAQNDGSVTAYLFGTDEIVISGNGNGKLSASPSMRKMFSGFTALEEINGIGDILNTEGVTDMSHLFYHCISLIGLDLSGWDVSEVKSFRGTFCCGYNQTGNARLKELNISGWDVSGATDMAYMFYGCGSMEFIDVSQWNTSCVKDFRHTFADCFKLDNLDVSRWDTRSVITFDGIFNDCRSLKTLDITAWNTSSCEEFDQMFDSCVSLKKIYGIEKINTSNGIGFEEMFFDCRSITELDLSSLDTRKADGHEFTAYNSTIKSTSNMKKMLCGCNSLKKLKLGENTEFFTPEMPESVIIQKLEQVGFVIVSPETGSMLPLIRPKTDQAVFKKSERYKKNDIVLFKSENGTKLVMHRIERVFTHGYLIRGDNSYRSEYIPRERVFASAVEIYRKNRKIKVGSLTFKLASVVSIYYNRLRYKYGLSNAVFWRIARRMKRALFGTNTDI